MFGNVLYFDKKKIMDYRAIAQGEKNIKIGKVDISNAKDANLKLPIAGGEIRATKSYEATIEESDLFDCAEFESILSGCDDYFDFTEGDYDLGTLTRGHIIKFESTIHVPEEFDMTQTIAQFKPYLMSSISKDMDSDEQAAFRVFFESENPKIPIVSECQDFVLCSKIDSKLLKIDYAQLDEYESLEVTILARILSSSSVSMQKAIFDPLKDFISLNRAIRRSMSSDRPDGLKELYIDEDYRNIEIIAIYQ